MTEFRILGPLDVSEDGRSLDVGGGKQRALLAVLLLHLGEHVPADRLVDALWGERPPASAANSVHVYVSRLRRMLGHERLLRDARGYRVVLAPDELDLDRFERLLAEADGVEAPVAADRLRAALALWRGTALADFAYEPFAQAAIGRLEELRLTAVEKRVEADLALGRHGELVGELDALVREHPLRERLCGQLMLALYRSGRQAEALEAYQQTRRTLVQELGIDPTPALQQLERAILRQDQGLDPASRAEPSVVPLASEDERAQRSILVLTSADERLSALLALAEPLARQPPRELILARLVAAPAEVAPAAALLNGQRQLLLAGGASARTAVFTSALPGPDTVRLAAEQEVDLLVVDGPPELFEDPVLATLLTGAACDVAVLLGGEPRPGPVLVPFVGAEHDWSAVELGAWFAGATGVPLRLAGPIGEGEAGRDASRLLASASLAVQRALGIAAEPVLVGPGADALVEAAADAGLVLIGLSDRWRQEGLGRVRLALANRARAARVLVRSGLRPGGLAPREQRTRFTWSLGPSHR